MNLKSWNLLPLIILAVFIYQKDCRGQVKNADRKLVVEYKYNTIVMTGARIEYAVYFIVDSAKSIVHNKRKFYQFCFSSDSTEITGYVNYNASTKTVGFIAKDYQNEDPYCGSGIVQSVFIFKNSKTKEICYLGEVGTNFNLISERISGKSAYNYKISVSRNHPIPSENRFIKALFFKDGFYPSSILIEDPFLPKDVNVTGNIK